MTTIKHILAISAFAMGIVHPTTSIAAPSDQNTLILAQATAAMTDGEVKKVDQKAGKITIKHGEIKHLDMPGMTMVFTAQNPTQLANVKAGDKIKFMVIDQGGKMIVTDIQPAK